MNLPILEDEPLKISSSQHEVEYESPPRHYYYSSSSNNQHKIIAQQQQHATVSAKGALRPPRSVELFDTMPHYYDRSSDHDRMLWLVNQNIEDHYLVPPPPLANSDMDKTDTGVNESNDEDEEDRHVKAQKLTGNEEDCVPKATWQTTSYPTCNNIHEIDFIHSVTRQGRSHIFAQSVHDRRFVTNYSSSKSLQQKQEMDLTLLGQGWFRSAWKVETETAPFKIEYDDDEWDAEWLREESLVLKTLRIEREFLDEYYELHRRDAMAMERLTHSKYVLDVYGYCGQSVLNELASHGTLLTMMKYQAHKRMRLKLAYGIARGVSDLHSIDYADFSSSTVGKKSNSTLVHYDLNFHNIAIQDGRLPKLNDFNVAMFLSWDPKKRATCGFEGRFMEPWYRSPEEMQNHIDDGTDGILLDEKIDVYSLGNILWGILTGKPPWKKDKDPIAMDELRPRVARGELPELPAKFANSTDPTIIAIRDAMFKCLRVNPEERASAGEVAHDLKLAMIEVKRLEKEEKRKKKEAEKIKKAEEAAAKELKLEEQKKEAEEAAASAFDKEGADYHS